MPFFVDKIIKKIITANENYKFRSMFLFFVIFSVKNISSNKKKKRELSKVVDKSQRNLFNFLKQI